MIVKQRNGPVVSVDIEIVEEYARFDALATQMEAPQPEETKEV